MLGARKSEMSCKDVGDGIKERVFVPTVLYGAESSGVNVEERSRLNVFEMKCMWSMAVMTLRHRINNDVAQIRKGMVKKFKDRVD